MLPPFWRRCTPSRCYWNGFGKKPYARIANIGGGFPAFAAVGAILNKYRIVVAALGLSAAGFGSLALYEGYCASACIPVPGDVPTIGLGSTKDVKLGDKITPPVAIARALREIRTYEDALKGCVTVPLTQGEYDAYVDLAYNIGAGAFCSSTLVRELNAGNYDRACARIEDFVCGPATPATAAKPGAKCYSTKGPKRVLPGLQARRAATRATCEGRPA
jgi:lysozyme